MAMQEFPEIGEIYAFIMISVRRNEKDNIVIVFFVSHFYICCLHAEVLQKQQVIVLLTNILTFNVSSQVFQGFCT